MKRSQKFPLLVAASVGLAFVPVLVAQQPLNSEVAISKIETAFVDSPKIPAGTYQKRTQGGRPAPWLEVEVTFDRLPGPKAQKFADELTVNYYILLKNDGATEDRKPTLLTGTVSHVNVGSGRGLHSVAYVSPHTLLRYFDGKVPVNAQQSIVDAGVTISGKDGVLAISTLKGSVKGDKGWWDNTELYTPTPGYVLNKDQTPFAALDWDYYEALKPAAAK